MPEAPGVQIFEDVARIAFDDGIVPDRPGLQAQIKLHIGPGLRLAVDVDPPFDVPDAAAQIHAQAVPGGFALLGFPELPEGGSIVLDVAPRDPAIGVLQRLDVALVEMRRDVPRLGFPQMVAAALRKLPVIDEHVGDAEGVVGRNKECLGLEHRDAVAAGIHQPPGNHYRVLVPEFVRAGRTEVPEFLDPRGDEGMARLAQDDGVAHSPVRFSVALARHDAGMGQQGREAARRHGVHVEVDAALVLENLQPQQIRLVGDVHQRPAEDLLWCLDSHRLEVAPGHLPVGPLRLILVVEKRLGARVYRQGRFDGHVVDEGKRLAAEIRLQPENEMELERNHRFGGTTLSISCERRSPRSTDSS